MKEGVSGYTGRFAPSPTGPLHRGSLLTALASFLDARANGGRWLLRIEDIDPPREMAGAAAAIIRSLRCHGLHWDGEIVWQSQRLDAYREALAKLAEAGMLFPCVCTRAELGPGGNCGGRCRPGPHDTVAQRLRIRDGLPGFRDRFCGVQSAQAGARDLVLWRKDGLPAYQLAVSVDDGWQGITEVVRGADLLETTAAQRFLLGALGHVPPTYGHLPLLRGEDGRKLSKQNGAPALDDACALQNLQEALSLLGQTPERGAGTPERLLARAIDSWAPGMLPLELQPGARRVAAAQDDAREETRL